MKKLTTMKNSILFAFSLAFLLACNPLINEDQQKNLEELSLKVDSSVMALYEIDSSKIAYMNKSHLSSQAFLLDSLRDTVDNKTIFFIDSFLRMKKPLQFLVSKYSPLKKEALTQQDQMRNLNQDVKNKHIDEEHFDNYYELEKTNYLQLEDAVTQITRVYQTALKQFNRMEPKIDSIISESKNKVND